MRCHLYECESSSSVKDHTPLFIVQAFTLGHFRSLQDSAKEEAYRLSTKNEFKSVFKVWNLAKFFLKEKWIMIFILTCMEI